MQCQCQCQCLFFKKKPFFFLTKPYLMLGLERIPRSYPKMSKFSQLIRRILNSLHLCSALHQHYEERTFKGEGFKVFFKFVLKGLFNTTGTRDSGAYTYYISRVSNQLTPSIQVPEIIFLFFLQLLKIQVGTSYMYPKYVNQDVGV